MHPKGLSELDCSTGPTCQRVLRVPAGPKTFYIYFYVFLKYYNIELDIDILLKIKILL